VRHSFCLLPCPELTQKGIGVSAEGGAPIPTPTPQKKEQNAKIKDPLTYTCTEHFFRPEIIPTSVHTPREQERKETRKHKKRRKEKKKKKKKKL